VVGVGVGVGRRGRRRRRRAGVAEVEESAVVRFTAAAALMGGWTKLVKAQRRKLTKACMAGSVGRACMCVVRA
jgi:hypothetical protein